MRVHGMTSMENDSQSTMRSETQGSGGGGGTTAASGVEPGDMPGYLKDLEKELGVLEESGNCPLALAYIRREIEKVNNKTRDPPPVVDITKDVPIAISCRVPLPVKEYPKFNFVGKLLGPRGNSLKRLQESTMSRMMVCGRGSMRDKNKEEELRTSNDPKFAHLKADPYLDIVVRAPPAEAYARLAHALTEIRPYLTPSKNDAISMSQMREMEGLNLGGVDRSSNWQMGGYPNSQRAGGPMGMRNGPGSGPFGDGGPNGPPGPPNYRSSYPPPAGGNYSGPGYGAGPGYGGGPGGFGGGPSGFGGPGAGNANPGGFGGYGPGSNSSGGFGAGGSGRTGGNQGYYGGGGGGVGGRSGPAGGGCGQGYRFFDSM